MIIAIWIATALLLALWSLVTWGLHALLALVAGSGGAADLKPLIDQIPHGELIDRWLPGWRELALFMMDIAQVALGWVGGAASLLTWLAWGLGGAVLLLAAGALTLLVKLVRPAAPALRPAG